jgi:hypothetical protein
MFQRRRQTAAWVACEFRVNADPAPGAPQAGSKRFPHPEVRQRGPWLAWQASVADRNRGELVSMLAGSGGSVTSPASPGDHQRCRSSGLLLPWAALLTLFAGRFTAPRVTARSQRPPPGCHLTWLSLTAWHPGGRADHLSRRGDSRADVQGTVRRGDVAVTRGTRAAAPGERCHGLQRRHSGRACLCSSVHLTWCSWLHPGPGRGATAPGCRMRHAGQHGRTPCIPGLPPQPSLSGPAADHADGRTRPSRFSRTKAGAAR